MMRSPPRSLWNYFAADILISQLLLCCVPRLCTPLVQLATGADSFCCPQCNSLGGGSSMDMGMGMGLDMGLDLNMGMGSSSGTGMMASGSSAAATAATAPAAPARDAASMALMNQYRDRLVATRPALPATDYSLFSADMIRVYQEEGFDIAPQVSWCAGVEVER